MAHLIGMDSYPNPKIQITFHRKEFSKTTCDYLCSKLDPGDVFDSALMFNLQGLTNKSMPIVRSQRCILTLNTTLMINLYKSYDIDLSPTLALCPC